MSRGRVQVTGRNGDNSGVVIELLEGKSRVIGARGDGLRRWTRDSLVES